MTGSGVTGRSSQTPAQFNTARPPVIPLHPDGDQDEEDDIGDNGGELDNSGPILDNPDADNAKVAINKLQEALEFLPREGQNNITDMIKKLVGDSSSVASSVRETVLDPENALEDPSSGTFTEMCAAMTKVVRDYVPSVPEAKMSPVKRKRTAARIDREEAVSNLPLHPDITVALESCMKEVKDSGDRGDTLSVGSI